MVYCKLFPSLVFLDLYIYKIIFGIFLMFKFCKLKSRGITFDLGQEAYFIQMSSSYLIVKSIKLYDS